MKRILFVVAALLLASPVWADDGGACPASILNRRPGAGKYNTSCYYLCDSKDSADTTCEDFTIVGPFTTATIEIADYTACSGAATATIEHTTDATLDPHALTALALGGTTAVTIDGAAAQTLSVLQTDLSAMTACTDFDVLIHLYYER